MLQNVYYQLDDNLVYLHLDACLRQIPDAQTFVNLFGFPIDKTQMNQFASRSTAPMAIGYPLLSGADLYTVQGNNNIYFSDAFPWAPSAPVLRQFVTQTQMILLGFDGVTTQWSGGASFAVPMTINSGQNWHLQTFFSGYHIVYNHLCHPENPINPMFKSWLDNNFSKAEVKSRIIQTQHQIDELAGSVAVLTPSFSPAGGVFYNPTTTVTITCPTPNAAIYFTTDGTAPLPRKANLYTQPVTLNLQQAVQLKAIAEYPDTIGVSAVEDERYSFQAFPVQQPQFSPAPGAQPAANVNVVISCQTPNVTIYYTTNGSAPTTASAVYSSAIALNLSQGEATVKAMAVHNIYQGSSDIGIARYDYKPAALALPVFDPAPGYQITPNVLVKISSVPGASIYYTTDGTTPDTTSNSYSTPVNLVVAKSNKTLMALATLSGSSNSPVASGVYSGKPWTHAWRFNDGSDDMIGLMNLTNQSVTYQQGKQGNAASFNGSASLTATTAQDMQNAVYSIAVWFKLTSMPSSYAPIWMFEPATGQINGPSLTVKSDGTLQGETMQNNNDYARCKTSVGAVTAGTWVHAVLVAGSDNFLRLYMNGVEANNVAFNGTISATSCASFTVGARLRPAIYSNGLIERLYYINQALTATEVQQLYSLG